MSSTLPPLNQKHSSTNGRALNNSLSISTTRLNPNSHPVLSPGPSNQHSTRGPSPNNNKSRQKSKAQQSRPKITIHHPNNASDPRPKPKPKPDSKPKTTNPRFHLKPHRPDAQRPTPISNTRAPLLDLKLGGPSAGGPKQDRHVAHDDSEDDETEGEVEATDPDTEAEPDTNAVVGVVLDPSLRRPLTVDPFSAEEERIITVLSRKLEQLRESEATSPVDTTALTSQHEGEGFRAASSMPPQLMGAGGQKQTQKQVAPVHDDRNTITNGHPTTVHAPSRPKALDRTSSVDSCIYTLSPSPTPSSPSSVYAAGALSPVNFRSVPATSTKTNGEAKNNNGHAVPIAVNSSLTANSHAKGKGKHLDYGGGASDDIPIDFKNARGRAYGTHISTLSSPEMSLSASPCEAHDTRWMAPRVIPNGIVLGAGNGGTSDGKTRYEDPRIGRDEWESRIRPSEAQVMLHTLMRENEQLKSRVASLEGDFMRLARLSEAYREELIGHRTGLGLSVDSLVNPLSFPQASPYTHPPEPPTYQYPSSYTNNGFIKNGNSSYHNHYPYQATSSSVLDDGHKTGGSHAPNKSEYRIGCENGRGMEHARNAGNGMPIPRPPSQVHAHRHKQLPMMPMSVPSTDVTLLHTHGSTSRTALETEEGLSSSIPSPTYPSPPDSAPLFSPAYSSSYSATSSASSARSSASASTNVTSPPSSLSYTMMMMIPPTLGVPSVGLSYPAVPPPSLSSSLGSTSWDGSENLSPVEP